jgi:hypothetical protein
MSTITINNEDKSSLPGWVCAQDAQARNKKNKDNFTLAEIDFSEELHSLAKAAYFRSRVFLNYRENFIAIKVERPNRADLVSKEVAEFEQFCKDNSIDTVKTATAIIYRIK